MPFAGDPPLAGTRPVRARMQFFQKFQFAVSKPFGCDTGYRVALFAQTRSLNARASLPNCGRWRTMPSKAMETPGSKRELFDSIRRQWPDEFRIPDEQAFLPTVLTEPSDVDAYRAVEQRIGQQNEWHQLAAWSFHQAHDKLVRRRHKESKKLVRSKDVSFRSFDTQMKSNLTDSSWDAERPIYSAMPLR